MVDRSIVVKQMANKINDTVDGLNKTLKTVTTLAVGATAIGTTAYFTKKHYDKKSEDRRVLEVHEL